MKTHGTRQELVERLVEGVESVGVVSCSVHPCKEGYCRNEGQCEAREGEREPVCSCREGFRGRRCHKELGAMRGLRRYDRKYRRRGDFGQLANDNLSQHQRIWNNSRHKKRRGKGRRKH